ncbi:MAG: ABC transporter ATP-binding protein [Bacteroidales bacterium]|nr:ABC transporter ATP-binding protein [Bacteroidales bacterium]MCF8455174.1 ABC transporter ATP-binding protein [Bacteroidales bacterium]
MQNQNPHSIELQNLSVGFAQGGHSISVLKNVNLKVRNGETIALLGLNGSGKSTLLRSIARLQPVLSGEVRLNDVELGKWPKKDLARHISFVSTEIINSNNLQVFDLVALGRFPHTTWTGKLGVDDKKVVYNALEAVGISSLAYKKMNELSDGEKQRTMIARALAQDTPIIILDEPTAFLDLPHKYEIFRLLQEQSRTFGKSIIIAIHDLNIALQEADKIWLASAGSIVEGAPEDLILNQSIIKVFGQGKAEFDFVTGNFKMPRKQNLTICFQAKGIEAEWTKKALERLGFQIDCNLSADLSVTINQIEKGFTWVLINGEKKTTCHSIYELSIILKTLNQNNHG